MAQHAETSSSVARERVEKAATGTEAAQYIYREVGLGALWALAKMVGMRVGEHTPIAWCTRLAERLRGNPVA